MWTGRLFDPDLTHLCGECSDPLDGTRVDIPGTPMKAHERCFIDAQVAENAEKSAPSVVDTRPL